ncbi:MAG: SIMPL domain-containing protein [Pirellulales bacterium]
MRLAWFGALLAFCSFVSCFAQAQEDSSVTASGTARLERAPDFLRMHVRISANGKNVREALEKLQARRESVRDKLKDLAVEEDSIEFSEPSINATMSDRQRQMEALMRQRSGKTKKKPGDDAPRPVMLAQTLQAEWKLGSENSEELLVLAHELQEAIKEADVAGAKEAEPLSPEEEELAEEMSGLYSEYSGSDEPSPGTAAFSFVCKISDEERGQATAEAFEKARDEAARLAAAAGKQLGELRLLRGDSAGGDYESYGEYQYSRDMMLALARQRARADNMEAIGAQPGKVSFQVQVSASFSLK